MPSTSSVIAVGWSPFGSYSDLISKRTPPSDFSGRGGRCGVHTLSWPSSPLNSGRPSRIRLSSASAVALTPSASILLRGGRASVLVVLDGRGRAACASSGSSVGIVARCRNWPAALRRSRRADRRGCGSLSAVGRGRCLAAMLRGVEARARCAAASPPARRSLELSGGGCKPVPEPMPASPRLIAGLSNSASAGPIGCTSGRLALPDDLDFGVLPGF